MRIYFMCVMLLLLWWIMILNFMKVCVGCVLRYDVFLDLC